MSNAVLGIEGRVAGCRRDLVHRKHFSPHRAARSLGADRASSLMNTRRAAGQSPNGRHARACFAFTDGATRRSNTSRGSGAEQAVLKYEPGLVRAFKMLRQSNPEEKNVSAGTTIRKRAAKGAALSYVIRCVGVVGSVSWARLDVCEKRSKVRRKS